MNKNNFRTAIIVIVSAILLVFMARSFSPFGLKAIYKFSYPDKNWIQETLGFDSVSDLGEIGSNTIDYLGINTDMAKFTLKLPTSPKKVTKAEVELTFKADKEARIGVTNSLTQEIESVAFFEPNIQGLEWTMTEEAGLSLFQKNDHYKTIKEFLSDVSITNNDGKGVGVYDYELEPIIGKGDVQTHSFETNSLLRGAHTLYVYVDNGPLIMNISKIDLNQYVGSDEVSVIGFKDGRNIFYEQIEDDGIIDKSSQIRSPQTIQVNEKLSSGIYKIIIDSGTDSVMTNLKINQGLVVFESLFFADNPEIYKIATEYKKNQLFTDADKIDFALAHDTQRQNVKIDDDVFYIDEKNKSIDLGLSLSNIFSLTKPKQGLSQIQIETNDIRVSSETVFSFSKEAFFKPYLSSTTSVSSSTQMNSLDYIIGHYQKAQEENGWFKQKLTIPIDSISPSQSSVEFSIFSSDKSKARSSSWIKIKDLQITLE